METPTLPDACTESAALRILDMPASRRGELRNLLPSVPSGTGRLYQKTAVQALASDLLEHEPVRAEQIVARWVGGATRYAGA